MRIANSLRPTLCVVVVASAVAGATAASITVATFADPAVDSNTPLFTLTGTQFQGGWSGTGLTLLTPGIPAPDIPNARFALPVVTATLIGSGVWTLGPGSVTFTDALNAPVLTITFGAASLVENIGFGASNLSLQSVSFTGPGVQFAQNERFAFSFANEATSGNSTTWTASFTSSGVPVPEPSSAALLAGAGLLSCLRRRCAP